MSVNTKAGPVPFPAAIKIKKKLKKYSLRNTVCTEAFNLYSPPWVFQIREKGVGRRCLVSWAAAA